MSMLIFTLAAANICLYFAFAALVPSFSDMLPAAFASLLLGPAACALGCLVSRKNTRLRFLFIPLPLLSLLLVQQVGQLLLLAPAVIYPLILLIAARFSAAYWDYRNHVLWSGCLTLLLLFLAQTHEPRPLPVLFGVGSLILGFFTLRQIRFGAVTGAKQRFMELGSLCAVPAASAFAVFLLADTKSAAAWLAERVLYPFGLLMQKIVGFLNSLIGMKEMAEQTKPEQAASDAESALDMVEEAVPPMELPEPIDQALDRKVVFVIILIAAAAAVCFIVWLYRRMRATRTEDELLERTDEETEAFDMPARAARASEHRSNRRKIRRIYERYLKLLRQRSFYRRPQDSSEDIVEKTRDILAQEPAQALRSLYIPARYDPNAVITDAQVRRARQLLQLLREEPKNGS